MSYILPRWLSPSLVAAPLCAAMVLLSCGKKSSDDTPSATSPDSVKLTGTWKSDCKSGSFLTESFFRKKVTFQLDGGFKRQIEVFDNDQCNSSRASQTLTGTYTVAGDEPKEPDAKRLNLTSKATYVTPQTDSDTANFNQSKYCGIADWKTGTEREVTGADCASGFKEGQVIFDVYRIQDNHIYFGATGIWLNGRTDVQRPEKVDLTDPHAKQ